MIVLQEDGPPTTPSLLSSSAQWCFTCWGCPESEALCLSIFTHDWVHQTQSLPLPYRFNLSTHPIAKPFTPLELSTAIAALPVGKSVGTDNIPNEFLKRLPMAHSLLLFQIFNQSWLSGSFPQDWRHAITFPIPKPGKDPSLTSSYHPASLLSCISKLFEHLVLTKLSWWLEHQHLLPNNMYGFRSHRSALDTLLELEHHLQEGFSRDHYNVAAFLDLEGAFDSASHNPILSKLSTLGLFGNPLAWVRSFLSRRTFSVAIGNTFSQHFLISRGVPQGSPLSPLLFNILLFDFPSFPNTHTFLYADDLSLLLSLSSRSPNPPSEGARHQPLVHKVGSHPLCTNIHPHVLRPMSHPQHTTGTPHRHHHPFP